MGGQDINESQDTLGVLKDKAHTIQHAATSTADHTFPGGTANFLRADGTFAAPSGGGSDPWTYLTLSAAFTTTSATAQAVTGLSFTPSANSKYDIFGMFYVKTAVTATVPRVGLAWPSGLNKGVATIYITAAATTQYVVNLNSASSGLTAVGAITSTAFWPAQMNAVIDVGASPSGSIVIQFCCEAANTAVVMGSGSFLKYRSYT